MRSKPFTASSRAALLKVCDVVRDRLGLGMLCTVYEFPRKDDGCETLASSFIFRAGWRSHVRFYPLFFKKQLRHQLEIVVHEHLHVMMQPLDQAILDAEYDLVRPKAREEFINATVTAREITVDHATGPIYLLLEPYIRRVL